MDRNKVIVKTSLIGIIANVALAAVKALIGLASNSIAIVLDAVNNLSDALSSVITIIGAKIAGKRPDKKHPLGHGRVEYLSAMIVAAIVIYAGVTSLIESVKKIINPVTPDYKTVSLVIIGIAIVVKIVLGIYVKKKGQQVNSGSLIASGADAMFDAVLSASVLASALLFMWKGISLEAYVGVLISIIIIKAGLEMITETANDILGKRADPELTKQIKNLLTEEPEVKGAFDLFLNNYGPDKEYASVHLELPDTMTVEEVDKLTRRVQEKVYRETGVIMTGVGVYAYNTQDNEAASIRNRVQEIVMNHEYALQMHGFFLDTESRRMQFDVVLSFDVDHGEGIAELKKEVSEAFPEYEVNIVADIDIAD